MKMLLQLLTLTALITQDIFLKYCNFHNSNKVNYFKVTVCLLKWILSLDWVKTWSVSRKQPERREREKNWQAYMCTSPVNPFPSVMTWDQEHHFPHRCEVLWDSHPSVCKAPAVVFPDRNYDPLHLDPCSAVTTREMLPEVVISALLHDSLMIFSTYFGLQHHKMCSILHFGGKIGLLSNNKSLNNEILKKK